MLSLNEDEAAIALEALNYFERKIALGEQDSRIVNGIITKLLVCEKQEKGVCNVG